MVFDQNLFFALCEKYDVELSSSVKEPMIKGKNGVRAVTSEDVSRIFAPCETFFGYSGEKLYADIISEPFCLQKNFAIAC